MEQLAIALSNWKLAKIPVGGRRPRLRNYLSAEPQYAGITRGHSFRSQSALDDTARANEGNLLMVQDDDLLLTGKVAPVGVSSTLRRRKPPSTATRLVAMRSICAEVSAFSEASDVPLDFGHLTVKEVHFDPCL